MGPLIIFLLHLSYVEYTWKTSGQTDQPWFFNLPFVICLEIPDRVTQIIFLVQFAALPSTLIYLSLALPSNVPFLQMLIEKKWRDNPIQSVKKGNIQMPVWFKQQNNLETCYLLNIEATLHPPKPAEASIGMMVTICRMYEEGSVGVFVGVLGQLQHERCTDSLDSPSTQGHHPLNLCNCHCWLDHWLFPQKVGKLKLD